MENLRTRGGYGLSRVKGDRVRGQSNRHNHHHPKDSKEWEIRGRTEERCRVKRNLRRQLLLSLTLGRAILQVRPRAGSEWIMQEAGETWEEVGPWEEGKMTTADDCTHTPQLPNCKISDASTLGQTTWFDRELIWSMALRITKIKCTSVGFG